jgi:hypothetical protein
MQHAYSTAPYSQALPSPAHHQFAHNRQTASPSSSHGQPYATPQMPHQQPSPGPALPSNGQSQPQPQPVSQVKPEPAQAMTPVKAVPPSPVSPVALARSQDRINTLLEINSILIREVCDLQSQGKAGQVGQPVDGKPEADKPQPTKEYVEYVFLRLVFTLFGLTPPQLHAPPPSQPRLPRAKRRKEPQARPAATARSRHHVRPQRACGPRGALHQARRPVPRLEGPDGANEAVPGPPAHELIRVHWLATTEQRGPSTELEPERHGEHAPGAGAGKD